MTFFLCKPTSENPTGNKDSTVFAARACIHKTGFTLIETALALLAISLGLLGIFGLARHGIKAGGDTQNETRCVMLADTVFATLKAKNDELAARKVSLYDWWNYWITLLGKGDQVTFYLPPMPEILDYSQPIGIAVGKQHELDDFFQTASTFTDIKWNPAYFLKLSVDLDSSDLLNTAAIYTVYERGQIDVLLTIHPGVLQSGAEERTYLTVLSYSGGLP